MLRLLPAAHLARTLAGAPALAHPLRAALTTPSPSSHSLLPASSSRLLSSSAPAFAAKRETTNLTSSAGSGQGGKKEKEAARKEKERARKEREKERARRAKEKAQEQKEKDKARKEREKAKLEKEKDKARKLKERERAGASRPFLPLSAVRTHPFSVHSQGEGEPAPQAFHAPPAQGSRQLVEHLLHRLRCCASLVAFGLAPGALG